MNKTSIPKLHSIKFKDGALAENVVHPAELFIGVDAHPMNVLNGAAEEMLTDVVLVGYDQFGREYVAGTPSDPARAAYMFSRGHLTMLRLSDEPAN